MNTCFSDGYGSLFHGLWIATWSEIHLVKFIDCADAVIRKHQRADFDCELSRFLVFDNSSCETCGGRRLAGRIDSSWKDGANVSAYKSDIRLVSASLMNRIVKGNVL